MDQAISPDISPKRAKKFDWIPPPTCTLVAVVGRVTALSVTVLVASCMGSSHQVCESGLICAGDRVCAPAGDSCVTVEELEPCREKANGDNPTLLEGGPGACERGLCQAYCGNGFIDETWETCDGDVPVILTCAVRGYDRGYASCSSLCQVDSSNCATIGWHLVEPPAPGSALEDIAVFDGGRLAGVGIFKAIGGNYGSFSIFDGLQWRFLLRGDDDIAPLHAVAGTSPTDVYAVGKRGTAVHWDGEQVQTLPTAPGDTDLWGVWLDPAAGRLVIAATGGVFEYRDGRWTPLLELGPSYRFNAVEGTADGHLYVVGFEVTVIRPYARDGVVLHHDGQTWNEVGRVTGSALFGVAVAAPGYVIAAGERGAITTLRDGVWNSVSRTAALFTDVYAASPNDIYIAGTEGTMLGNTGDGKWRRLDIDANAALTGLAGLGPDFIAASSPDGVFTSNGSAWSTEIGAIITGLALNGPDQGATIAYSGELVPFDGATAWQGGTSGLNFAELAYNDDGLYIGGALEVDNTSGGVVFYTAAGGFEDRSPPGIQPILSIDASGSDVIAVTTSAALHFDGAAWTTIAGPPDAALRTSTGASVDDFFVGGADAAGMGIVWHYDGVAWTPAWMSTEVPTALWASGTDLFVGLPDGVVHYFTDGQWQQTTYALTGDVINIDGGGSSSDVFAATNFGDLAYFDGENWSRIRAPASGLYLVRATATNVVFAGANTAVLERRVPW